MADYRNCSAGRLLWILEQCKAKHEQDRKAGRDSGLFTTWKTLFSMPDDTGDWYVLNSLAQFARLPYLVLSERSRFPENKFTERHFSWMKEVMQVCSAISAGATLSQFISPMKEVSFAMLEVCAHEYSHAHPERKIDEAELTVFREEVATLLDLVTKSDLPGDLKSFLWNQFWNIQSALDNYPICGILPVQESVQSYFGGLLLSRKKYDQIKEQEALCLKTESFLSRLVLALNLTDYGYKMVTTGTELFAKLLN